MPDHKAQWQFYSHRIGYFSLSQYHLKGYIWNSINIIDTIYKVLSCPALPIR